MQTILGPFHPHLENALVEEIQQSKEADPLCPLLILLPSDLLRRHLKIILTRERGFSFLNLQLTTFHQLASRLLSEIDGLDLPLLRDDLFLEEVLRQIIRSKQPGTEAFAGIDERAGGCAALWQTLRDLRDGMVDPSLALDALNEGHFGRQTSDRMRNLLTLFQTLLRFCRERGVEVYSEFESFATERVPSSLFLKQFARIYCYGFYDLTQVQVDFFYALAQRYPTTLFFPLYQVAPRHDAWTFAERFFERYVQGRTTQGSAVINLVEDAERQTNLAVAARLFDDVVDRPGLQGSTPWTCRILNTFGTHDEIGAVAKEILDLVQTKGMAFEDVGIVARTLDSYGSIIKELFDRHSIPMARPLVEPLIQFPPTKSVILLLNLPAKDFLRAHVIDLLSSPYFRPPICGGEIAPRPDLWDLATRELGICKGIQEWRRLERYSDRDLLVSQITHDDEPRFIRITAAQIRYLNKTFTELHEDLTALPEHAAWSRYARAWKMLLNKYLGIGGDHESPCLASGKRLDAEILAVLDRMSGLDSVQRDISLNYFSQTFQHWLERSNLPTEAHDMKGVTVLNATAARGLSFRTLFIIGLNEGVFPRTIREDAFLRDGEREIFERDLGFKVNPKLAGFDEEKLIFTLLVSAARERLYCLFQRADESGRTLAPSWYLAELKRAVENQPDTHLLESTIPRSIADKAHTHPFNRHDLLLPDELAVRLVLEGKDVTSLIDAFELLPNVYRQGRQVVERLDRRASSLDAFDGIVKPLAEFWLGFSQRGISPTALETYGRCPFQFFARHVLGLERLERPEEIAGPSPADFGELGHLILKLFYQELIDKGYFTGKTTEAELETVLATAARQVCGDYELTNPVGYPLAWKSLQESLTHVLVEVAAQDVREISTSGYVPTELEIDIKAQFDTEWPEPLTGLTIHGRMDRVDYDRNRNRLRVIDYKFKIGASATALDRDLRRAALRGERLQPVFYSLLGKQLAARKEPRLPETDVEANFYYIAPKWIDGPLVRANFDVEGLSGNLGQEIKNTVSLIANGIRHGRFFIRPGNHCAHCDVSEICRKNHPPSRWRADNDPITRPHRELHEKDPKRL